MLLGLSITGITLSVILLYFNARRFRSSVYLGSFFLLISMYSFIQYSLFYSRSTVLVASTYISAGFITYLIGPSIYLYVRSILNDEPSFKRRDLWHLFPALLFLITSLPYIFSPWVDKLQNASEIVKNIGFIGTNKPTVLFRIMPHVLIYLSRPVLVMTYTLWSLILFIRFTLSRKKTKILSQQRYMIRWMSLFLGFLVLLSVSQFITIGEAFVLKEPSRFFTFNVLLILSLTGLTGLLVSPFFFPGILYGLPRYPIYENEEDISETVFSDDPIQKRKYPGFEDHYLEQIGVRIDSCMNSDQIFLDNKCNLSTLSKCSRIPVHHLAYYFREVKKQSFNDFRNELRVDYAKNLIRKGKAKEVTLEAIGLQSGFSTRNTFFTSFKKAEGISPSAYLSKIH